MVPSLFNCSNLLVGCYRHARACPAPPRLTAERFAKAAAKIQHGDTEGTEKNGGSETALRAFHVLRASPCSPCLRGEADLLQTPPYDQKPRRGCPGQAHYCPAHGLHHSRSN